MQGNCYEAAASACQPHRLISAVGWASDSPMSVAPIPRRRVAGIQLHKYANAAGTQLFYTSNLENDGVIAKAQDGSGYKNANFMAHPGGQNGRCRMYLWNTANPHHGGDLEAGIAIHELSRGLSTRLAGGPATSGCLGWGESGGMGEGWGDFLATTNALECILHRARARSGRCECTDSRTGSPSLQSLPAEAITKEMDECAALGVRGRVRCLPP
ncbi:Fungalysin metallopeptidase-domain-containing protein [Fomitopsis serialis]|uniref:Fungalysin metallopeptidase-domain-containing protein n=1 Tax=Fomitopsis serialis TaxID=139415 RepID=UPI002007C454|nr:Fungalysin metallopeptidase-domain-containing protein [Neoantrodia serialis]KAH9916147.1 Fungalysin metallopeptidase-domain-containing protein [Neoantrodia serialis]